MRETVKELAIVCLMCLFIFLYWDLRSSVYYDYIEIRKELNEVQSILNCSYIEIRKELNEVQSENELLTDYISDYNVKILDKITTIEAKHKTDTDEIHAVINEIIRVLSQTEPSKDKTQ